MSLKTPEERIEEHDIWLRGDGKDKGLIPNVLDLLQEVKGLKVDVDQLKLMVARLKGWVAGAIAVGGASGGILVWILEKFVFKTHP